MIWIKTSIRRPEAGSSVLAFWTPMGGLVNPDCYGVATFASASHWHNPENDEDDYREPTHWMPLPEPPKEQQCATTSTQS